MPRSNEIRRQFIDYFVQRHAHREVPSCPVVPHDDPSLLFTNAGMNQFKDVFLGIGKRDYQRAVNTQKCIRAGGKHNDLEDVGNDTYHHTFFEMLGNWSFGDYFKEEAIAWAWDLLVNHWGLDKSRLHATVFGGDTTEGLAPDHDAADLWKRVTDIDPSHIHLGNKRDNFWEMGDSGPCGPCSEIHFDLTPDRSGGGLVNTGDASMIEIWNLVFIQFNRDHHGKLSPLPAKHVDTGMGFERICAVLQGKRSNYDTDVFEPIFAAIRQVTGARPYAAKLDDNIDTAYRVIADHIRCLTFALTDGATPSNEGRGYVLRRILRRAVRHGHQTLGVKDPFLFRLVPAVVDALGDVFGELKADPQRVVDLIKDEETSFGKTLDRGIALFCEAAQRAQTASPSGGRKATGVSDPAASNNDRPGHRPIISAHDAFKLHDTYGFPLDLTQVMAQERAMDVDVAGFDRLMTQARVKARSSQSKGDSLRGQLVEAIQQGKTCQSQFVGYDQIDCQLTVSCGWTACDATSPLTGLWCSQTPFYAEAGGQAGDRGTLQFSNGAVFRVENTLREGSTIFHIGAFENGDPIRTPQQATDQQIRFHVDRVRREKIMANHTGTHLANKALREVLGDHVQQKGSLVDDEKLRFDFSHHQPLTIEQIDRIEQTVNVDMTADVPVYTGEAALAGARQINGLRAVFGEKYPPRVRVVSIGVPVGDLLANPDNTQWRSHSIEFCGGTHLKKTGDAEGFVIVNEEAVAKGVRRLTAMTGQAAHRASAEGQMLLARLETIRGADPDQLASQVGHLATAAEGKLLPLLTRSLLRQGIAQLQQVIKDHTREQNKTNTGAVIEAAKKIADESQGHLIVTRLEGADANALRAAMDVIRKKKPDSALLVGGVFEEKVAFIAAVPKHLIAKGLKAGDWVREVAKAAGGGGGGRPDMAQAGGKDPLKLDEALAVGRTFAQSKL